MTGTSSSAVTRIPGRCETKPAPTLCAIHHHRDKANHLRRRLGQRPIAYHYIAERHPARRDRILGYWRHVHQRTLNRWHHYGSAITWAGQPGPSCVSGHEGGLTSVNPAGPYYGKWQADSAFERAYNPTAQQRYGHANHWPERDQDYMAWRGHAKRGWAPWPNTSAMCGLG